MKDMLLERYGTSRNGHSIFAPSSASMWLHCSGSLLAGIEAVDDAGEDAAYGTVAHHVAETWQKEKRRPAHLIGTTMTVPAGGTNWRIKIDDTMLHHVQRFIEWCDEVPGDHYYEQRVDLTELMPIPGQGGTADHFACEVGKLTITDLKMGTGVRVYAEKNPQAMLYAAGVFLEWDWIYRFEKIVIRICQPRLDVFEIYECSREELQDFMAFARVRAFLAWTPDAPRSPSPKACKWCKVKATCAARLNELEDIADQTFGDLGEDDRPEPTYDAKALEKPGKALMAASEVVRAMPTTPIKPLSTAALAYTLTFRKHVEDWFKAIEKLLLERAESGEAIRYFKLTDGRTTFKWKDPDAAVNQLTEEYGIAEDELRPRTMISVAKVRKLIRAKSGLTEKEVKAEMTSLVKDFAGKRGLAPEKDDRPDVADLIDETFTEDEDDD